VRDPAFDIMVASMAYMVPGRRDAVDAMPRRLDAVDVASEIPRAS